jgi:hypothetical protein
MFAPKRQRMSTPAEHAEAIEDSDGDIIVEMDDRPYFRGLIGCGHNEKKNSCDDLEMKGKANVSTANQYYTGYYPQGWMRNPGRFNHLTWNATYDAVPAYDTLALTPCRDDINACKNYFFTNLWTGVKTNHGGRSGNTDKYMVWGNNHSLVANVDLGGYSFQGGGACPSRDSNQGLTPVAQRSCSSCSVGNCQKGAGYWGCDGSYGQYLCAVSFDRPGTCQTIGETKGEQAFTGAEDALKQKVGTIEHSTTEHTEEPGFNNDTDRQRFLGRATCSYPYDSIKTETQLLQAQQLIEDGKIPGNDKFIGAMMEHYCGQIRSENTVGSCITNEFTATTGTCSNYMSNTQGGDVCREWLKKLRNKPVNQVHKTYDQIIVDHCAYLPDFPECKCIRRGDSEVYRGVSENPHVQSGNPFCWFKPCMSGIDQGMMRDLETDNVAAANDCKQTSCVSVNDFTNSHYNTVKGRQEVSCELGSGGNSETSVNTGDPNLQSSSEEDGYIFDKEGNLNTGVIIGIVVAVLAFMGIVVAFVKGLSSDSSGGKVVVQKTKEPSA